MKRLIHLSACVLLATSVVSTQARANPSVFDTPHAGGSGPGDDDIPLVGSPGTPVAITIAHRVDRQAPPTRQTVEMPQEPVQSSFVVVVAGWFEVLRHCFRFINPATANVGDDAASRPR